MFISKRAYNEAIDRASREAEKKVWEMYERDMRMRDERERVEKFEVRLRRVEEACGLVETETACPCGAIHTKSFII